MIPLLVFFIHIVAVTAAFTKRWQDEGLSEGMLAVFFMALIFFVGWSMTTFIMRLLMEPAGFGRFLDRDSASLLLLTLAEGVFYYFYLKSDPADDHASDSGVEESHNA